MKKSNAGRPKKKEGMAKNKRFIVRLSDEELKKFKAAANELDVTMSKLLRNATAFQHEYFDSPCMYKK